MSLPATDRNSRQSNTSGDAESPLTQLLHETAETNAGLARVVASWPELPEAIKADILAMVEAARASR